MEKSGRTAARKGKLGKDKVREKEKKEQFGGRSGTLPVFSVHGGAKEYQPGLLNCSILLIPSTRLDPKVDEAKFWFGSRDGTRLCDVFGSSSAERRSRNDS